MERSNQLPTSPSLPFSSARLLQLEEPEQKNKSESGGLLNDYNQINGGVAVDSSLLC